MEKAFPVNLNKQHFRSIWALVYCRERNFHNFPTHIQRQFSENLCCCSSRSCWLQKAKSNWVLHKALIPIYCERRHIRLARLTPIIISIKHAVVEERGAQYHSKLRLLNHTNTFIIIARLIEFYSLHNGYLISLKRWYNDTQRAAERVGTACGHAPRALVAL